ncbi:MAG: nitrilase-related carbon-nitrogen hydrolase, partial [Candidatus Nanopelagicales bacterium]|nr:nitrilase-related carbon-nitrogen hydrolase [Candidatus Nanopelagicales bacterium]
MTPPEATTTATTPVANEAPSGPVTSRKRTLLGLVLSALSGLMLFVMCDGHGSLWPLVIVAFVPMYVAQYRLLSRRMSGLAVGIAFFGYWLSLFTYSGSLATYVGGPVGGALIILVVSIIFSIPMWIFGIFERPFAERTRYKWLIVQLPLFWVALETVFGSNLLFGDNYWLAYRLAPAPSLAQPVSILSTPALSFLLIMFNAGVALLIFKWIDRRWSGLATVAIPARTVKWSSIIAFGVTIVWIGSSLAIYWQVNSQLGPQVRVAAAQTGNENRSPMGERAEQGTPGEIARNQRLRTQLERMTRSAVTQGAQLVVWPEEILEYDVTTQEGHWVGELAKSTNTTIVAGYKPLSPSEASPNMAAAWLPSGEILTPPYYKIHPVVLEGEKFKTPHLFPTYETPVGQLGLLICFDHDFPNSSARLDTLGGADILAVPAIDFASIRDLRWQTLTFRAIENRVPLIKADVAWDSAIVNANGDLAKRVAIADVDGAEALLVTDVNRGPRNSIFTVTGGYA